MISLSDTRIHDPIMRLRERVVYRNRFAAVYDDEVRFNDGSTGAYVRVVQSDGQPGVVALPVAGNDVALVRVYRYPVGAWEWGLPRGLAHGDDPAATVREELREELGVAPEGLIPLGRMTPDSGILASVVDLFAASYSHMPTATRDTREVAAVRWVAGGTLLGMIASGDVTDGFTLAAVCVALCRGILS